VPVPLCRPLETAILPLRRGGVEGTCRPGEPVHSFPLIVADRGRRWAGMNAPLAAQLSSLLPLIGVLLQGAAFGSLLSAAVLLRAFRRGLAVTPWAVTAAWSLLGAGGTLVVVLPICVTGLGGQRSIRGRGRGRLESASEAATALGAGRGRGSRREPPDGAA
jgi:hypothetical protein